MEPLKRADAPYRFQIPNNLLPKLRERQARQNPWSEVVDGEDVVHLYYGLGPALFLTFDGRIITDAYEIFDESRDTYEVTDPKEAWTAVAIGADVWTMPELRRLLPERPADATDCQVCRGAGWLLPTALRPQGAIVCWECGALGWQAPTGHSG